MNHKDLLYKIKREEKPEKWTLILQKSLGLFLTHDYAYYGLKCFNDYGDTVVCKHKEYGKRRQCNLLVIGLWAMMMPCKKYIT